MSWAVPGATSEPGAAMREALPSMARRLLNQWETEIAAGRLSPFAAINGAYWLGMAAGAKARQGREAGCSCRYCPLTPGREEDGFGQNQRQQGR